ncbi:MAG TPA: hypothetical protein VFL55_12655 [Acetobacteraceae bacterium]|nr:hypothetical protein [Acetobacteraceae bacterium]
MRERVGVLTRIRARAPIYIADTRQNPAWLAMFILARLTPVRQLLWRLLPAAKPVSQTVTSAVFGRVPISELVTELRATGLTQGIALPESICRGIREFAGQHDCFGNFDRSLAFQASQHVEAQRAFRRAILTGQYLNRIKDCRTSSSCAKIRCCMP